MGKNRGLHNYMQRRARFRSPGPPPRVRAGGRAGKGVYAKRTFKVPPPPYEHQHRRPIDFKHLQALIERQNKLSRALDRARRSWERLLGRDDLFLTFTDPPERQAVRRGSRPRSTTYTTIIVIPTTGMGSTSSRPLTNANNTIVW